MYYYTHDLEYPYLVHELNNDEICTKEVPLNAEPPPAKRSEESTGGRRAVYLNARAFDRDGLGLLGGWTGLERPRERSKLEDLVVQ